MIKRNIIILTLFLMLLANLNISYAEPYPPLPEKKKAALNSAQERYKAEQNRKDALEKQVETIKSSLSNTKQELIKVTKDVKDSQATLDSLKNKIKTLSDEQTEITKRLEQDYGSIAELVIALERMRRIPPETLIIRPGAPYETAQTAMLLQSILPTVYNRADKLSQDLNKLNTIKKELETDRKKQIIAKNEFEKKQKEMSSLLKTREKLFSKTQGDLTLSKRRTAQLAKEAKNMEELLDNLARENQRQTARTQTRHAVFSGKQTLPQPGQASLPVRGRVLTSFGQLDAIGAKSHGIKVEAKPSEIVTSPMGGIVRFSGHFKNYGEILIIEHKNQYHSLIAGFAEKNVQVGQSVEAGEPIGKLPYTSSRGGRPTLYYELRFKGKAINPSQKFSGLKS